MKPNNKKGNNNKQQNNYFTQGIRERGEDFIQYKSPRDLQNDALRIFREIARGQIDLERHGNYFLAPQFLESCLQAAWNKYSFHSISATGVDMLITNYMNSGMMPDDNVIGVKEQHKRTAEAYCIIYQTLCTLRTSGDLSNLFVLVSKLQNYKYNL